MKIYTKTGDKGMTSLFGGKRVWKDDLRIDAYGSVDEINSFLGLAITEISDESIKAVLRKIQNDLFVVGSDLAYPREAEKPNSKVTRVDASFFESLENEIDKFNSDLPDLKHFILPGGTKGASFLQAARTICRRAERNVIKLCKNEEIGENISIYLNRLSDFLFVLARYENHISQTPDVEWKGS